MSAFDRLKRAMNESIELARRGDDRKALEIIDDAIKQAIHENEARSVGSLCRTAAVICNHAGELDLEKRYSEQALAYCPDDALSAYTLADISLRQGNVDAAKDYAAKSYQICKQRIELDNGIIEMLLDRWPELAGSTK